MRSLCAGFLAIAVVTALSSCVPAGVANKEQYIRSLNEGEAALKKGYYDQAEKAFEKCVQLAETFGESDPKLVEASIKLAEIKCSTGHLDDALKLADRACSIVQSQVAANPDTSKSMGIYLDLGQCLAVKAKILRQDKNVFASRKAYRDSLHYLETGMASLHAKYAVIREMTDMLKENGLAREAEIVLKQYEEISPAPGMSTGAVEAPPKDWQSAFNAAYQAQEGGNFTKARELYEVAVRFAVEKTIDSQKHEKHTGRATGSREVAEDNMHLARSLRGLGVVSEALGEFDQAEKIQLRALSVLEKNAIQDDKENSIVSARLSSIFARKKNFAAAEKYGLCALTYARANDAGDKFARNERRILEQMSDIYQQEGKFDQAIYMLKRKLALEKAAYHKPSEKYPLACDALARAYIKARKPKEAELVLKDALAYCRDVSDEVSEVQSNVMEHYSSLLLKQGRTQEAEVLAQQVREFRGQTKTPSSFSDRKSESGPEMEEIILKP